MKEGLLLQILWPKVKRLTKKLYANKFKNLDKLDKFLEN